VNRAERFAVIERYLSALRQLGSLDADGTPLREALRSGAADLWTSSSTRESSLWRDPTLADQINALISTTPKRSEPPTQDGAGFARSLAAWARALMHAARRTPTPALAADVVFVQYWPTLPSTGGPAGAEKWQSPYFGSLPDELAASGVSVGFLHLHADGPVTKPLVAVERAVRATSSARAHHALVSDGLSIGGVFRAFSTWLKIVRRCPGERRLSAQITPGSDLDRVWRWWRRSLYRSVRGSQGVRNVLLSEMFREVLRANGAARLWVVAFEGQGWESCLARQLEASDRRWLPYLHTVMRPWDLRAHTFLSEHRVGRLAVHGRHDRTELAMHDIEMVDVEALRYQHLGGDGTQPSRSSADTPSGRTWMIVGGGDCELSHEELLSFLGSMRRRMVARRVVARWHPQCNRPSGREVDGVEFSVAPLHELARQADAAFMVGRAAPLDTYLAGVPSCHLLDESGLAMSPVDDDDSHRAAADSDDAVQWMLAAEQNAGTSTRIDDYFIIDAGLPRWKSVVTRLLG